MQTFYVMISIIPSGYFLKICYNVCSYYASKHNSFVIFSFLSFLEFESNYFTTLFPVDIRRSERLRIYLKHDYGIQEIEHEVIELGSS